MTWHRRLTWCCFNVVYSLVLELNDFSIQLTLVISNSDISKYPLISKNISEHIPVFLHITTPVISNTRVSQSKFSGTRKFTSRYQEFETNFDYEISRVFFKFKANGKAFRRSNYKKTKTLKIQIKKSTIPRFRQPLFRSSYTTAQIMGRLHSEYRSNNIPLLTVLAEEFRIGSTSQDEHSFVRRN